jgi:hypothetical protein
MMTPKLTAVMVAMTALMGSAPIAAFAQAANVQEIGDLVNAAQISTGGNTQVNAAETNQVADNSIEIENEAESGDAEAEGGDAESEAEAEAKSGDAKNEGKKGEAESEAEADALSAAIGGDADATSGDATATQVLNNVTFDNDVTQESATVQTNNLDDSDEVTVAQTNVPVQTQTGAIAVDIDAEGITAEELAALIAEILGGGTDPCPLCG